MFGGAWSMMSSKATVGLGAPPATRSDCLTNAKRVGDRVTLRKLFTSPTTLTAVFGCSLANARAVTLGEP